MSCIIKKDKTVIGRSLLIISFVVSALRLLITSYITTQRRSKLVRLGYKRYMIRGFIYLFNSLFQVDNTHLVHTNPNLLIQID